VREHAPLRTHHRYPFLALVNPISRRAVAKIEGVMSVEELIAAIAQVLEEEEPHLTASRLDECVLYCDVASMHGRPLASTPLSVHSQ
jgi:actin-like ATPase involved in cell morphogenesis